MKHLFSYLVVSLMLFGGILQATEVSLEQKIAGLYVAFFNRAPDQSGLEYWLKKASHPESLAGEDKNYVDRCIHEIFASLPEEEAKKVCILRVQAKGFANHPTFVKTYGAWLDGGDYRSYVEAIYRNTLGREGDSQGVDYWTEAIESGRLTPWEMVAEFTSGALSADITPENFPGLSDEELKAAQLRKDLITNKVSVALDFTHRLGEKTNVKDSLDPEKDPAYIASINILSGVTEDPATVNAAMEKIIKYEKVERPGIQYSVCALASVDEAAIYVASDGSDENGDGSWEHPYATVAHAANVVQEGGTILIRGGRYVEREEIRLRVPGVTIRSYPGEWAILDRSNSGNPAEDDYDSGIYLDVDADRSHVECLEVYGGFYGISTETKWQWGDPNDRSGTQNIVIRNVSVHGSYADGIKLKPKCNGAKIEHVEIYDTGRGQDPSDCNAEGIDDTDADRALVRYTYIHNTCSTGVYFKGGAQECIVEHSRIENAGEAGILLGFDTSPEYFDMDSNPRMYEAIHPIARYNLVIGSGGAGIGLFASLNAEVYFNTVVNSASRFHAPLYFGITYQDWEPDAVRPPNKTPKISSNIFIQWVSDISDDQADLLIRYSDDFGGLSALEGMPEMENNCYYNEKRTVSFADIRHDWRGGLKAWQDYSGTDIGSVEADPRLDEEYHPAIDGLCMGRGY